MSEIRPVIAVDAAGGDHGPSVVVPGAVAAFPAENPADQPYELSLYGDEAAIRAELDRLSADDLPISVVHCTQEIEMGEKPASAIKNKKDSPIVRGMADQRAGLVQAVVSAGSTGAFRPSAPSFPPSRRACCCSPQGPTPSAPPTTCSASQGWVRCSPPGCSAWTTIPSASSTSAAITFTV